MRIYQYSPLKSSGNLSEKGVKYKNWVMGITVVKHWILSMNWLLHT